MHAQEEAGAIGDGSLVIAEARAIGGAYFAEEGAAFGHDVWNAEAVTDLDEFAAGDDDFSGFRERVQDEKYRGGVVVDYDGGFGADQVREKLVRVHIAFAAFTTGCVVFEIRVAGGGGGDMRDGSVRKWGAA